MARGPLRHGFWLFSRAVARRPNHVESSRCGLGNPPTIVQLKLPPKKNAFLVMKSKNKSLFFDLTKENVSIYKLERCSSSKDFDMQSLSEIRFRKPEQVPPYIFATQTSPKLIWGNCTAFNLHYSGVICCSRITMRIDLLSRFLCVFRRFFGKYFIKKRRSNQRP